MSDTNTTVTTPDNTAQPDKTFTQDEVNAIVADRLAREKGKYADYDDLKAKAAKYDEFEEANKSELQRATELADQYKAELEGLKKANEVRDIRSKVATETGVPVDLLTADTEEECAAQAKSILAFAKPNTYPQVKDGGEPTRTGKVSTRQQFAEWAAEAFK